MPSFTSVKTPFANIKKPSFPLGNIPTISTPSLPSTPALPESITNLKKTLTDGGPALLRRKTIEEAEDDPQSPPPDETKLEPVYIVLRPLKLNEAPETFLKRLGRVVKAVEFENYLLLQHWGVLIGDKYYHLHTDDDKKISVALLPFTDETHKHHTIKFPIWRTALPHEERVGIAVGIIKAMGKFAEESDVDITDEKGNLIKDPEERLKYTMEGRYHAPPIQLSIFGGRYNPLANNCIHFTKHYIFDQVLTRKKELKNFTKNIQWIVEKWRDMGCRRSPAELIRFLSGILGMANPFTMTPEKGAKIMVKLLSIFLDIEYNPVLDKKLLEANAEPSEEALEEALDEGDGNEEAQFTTTEELMKTLSVKEDTVSSDVPPKE